MHGPAFDSEGKTVNRDVPEADVVAFENAGYKKGRSPDAPDIKAGAVVGSATKEEAALAKAAEADAKAEAKAEAASEAKDAKK
jgi:hypothetical protein